MGQAETERKYVGVSGKRIRYVTPPHSLEPILSTTSPFWPFYRKDSAKKIATIFEQVESDFQLSSVLLQ